mmetsp:Transcript_93116/g.263186  ORF Transcript_93116/g.263186 Transcript_93116/m.263186 type:complete len:205 (-) Transcript_93116:354-968(-)
MGRRASAEHPGRSQRSRALNSWGSMTRESSCAGVVVVVVVNLGRTRHATCATPLNRLPSYGHSSTIRLSVPLMSRAPVLSRRWSTPKSTRQEYNGRHAVRLHPRAMGSQRARTTKSFTVQASMFSRLQSSSKSVGWTLMFSLQLTASSRAALKACSVALAVHPIEGHLSVVFTARSTQVMLGPSVFIRDLGLPGCGTGLRPNPS